MLNRIIHASLGNRLAVLILSVLIMIAGCMTLLRMDVDIFPDLNAPTVVVMTEAPGMAAEEVENIVTYPIETAVNGATGVRRVRSSSTTGFSVVWVEFDWDTDIYLARQIVSERLDNISESLPETVDKPVMGPQSSILGEMMIIGLTADSTSQLNLRRIADTVIRPRLLSIGGVAQVSVIGGDAPEYQIRLDSERMRLLGISMQEVLEATENLNGNASGGIVYDYGNEYIVKTDINTNDTDEISKSVIRTGDNGEIITLADISEVVVGPRLPRLGLASVKAEPAVIITVTKQPGQGTIGLTEAIDAELAALTQSLPSDVKVSTDIFRQSEFIDNSISNLQEALLEGALFVIIVLFFFLMNLRTTVVSVVAIPMSIIITVLVLHFMGYTINTMSLGGIAIAIGCLVDDAIVDVENVFKRLRENRALPEGKRRRVVDVVFHASAEVRMPIFNSTLIIVAAFLPLFFLTGMEGRLLRPLGVAFIVALAASTVVALTLTPVLCSFLLDSGKKARAVDREPRTAALLKKYYLRSLESCLRHKTVLLSLTGVLFMASLVAFFSLGRGFLPSFNEGSFTINVSTLPGISLEESDRIGREAERIIMETPEITTVARKTGRAELDEHTFGVNTSEIEAPYVLDRGRTRSEVAREIRTRLSEIPGAVVEIGQPISHRIDAMLSGTKSQIAIKLFGPDLNRLFEIGRDIHSIVSDVDGVVDANIEQQVERPELVIRPRRDLLARYGILMKDFNNVISTALGGRVVSQVYDKDGYAYDITVVLDPEERDNLADIRSLSFATPFGPVSLSELADIRSLTGPNAVNRENVKRRLIISANVDGRDLRGTVNEIQQRVAGHIELPEDYFISYGGQFESEAQASSTLMWASLGALLVIFMLLYAEFKNIAQSLLILVNMPLALIGAVFILLSTGGEINIPAIIGFISLMGITTRNGMLLISRYNALRDAGMDVEHRIAAGSADRLLPIVMTALTSALALIPLAVNGDHPGNEIQSPMAIVILGGLISSTVLNVYVVPAIYQMICRKKQVDADE